MVAVMGPSGKSMPASVRAPRYPATSTRRSSHYARATHRQPAEMQLCILGDMGGRRDAARPQCARFVSVALASDAVPAQGQMRDQAIGALPGLDPTPAESTARPGRSRNIAGAPDQRGAGGAPGMSPSGGGQLIVSCLESRELSSGTPFSSLRFDTYVHLAVCACQRSAGAVGRLPACSVFGRPIRSVLYPDTGPPRRSLDRPAGPQPAHGSR